MGIYLDNVFCRKCKVKLDFTENVEAYEDKRFLCHKCKDKLGIPYLKSEVKMKVTVDIDEKQFGEITKRTGQAIAQDIINRYCNVEYYNQEELEQIANNDSEFE